MDKRVVMLKRYARHHGWIKVAAYLGYDDVAPCKQWANRKSIPGFVWSKLEKLLNGEADVTIQIK